MSSVKAAGQPEVRIVAIMLCEDVQLPGGKGRGRVVREADGFRVESEGCEWRRVFHKDVEGFLRIPREAIHYEACVEVRK